jgi:hypothetical protein
MTSTARAESSSAKSARSLASSTDASDDGVDDIARRACVAEASTRAARAIANAQTTNSIVRADARPRARGRSGIDMFARGDV